MPKLYKCYLLTLKNANVLYRRCSNKELNFTEIDQIITNLAANLFIILDVFQNKHLRLKPALIDFNQNLAGNFAC